MNAAQRRTARRAITNKTRDEVLEWLAKYATNAGFNGFRDGYISLAGDELARNLRVYGEPYRQGFYHGQAVSPLLHDTELPAPSSEGNDASQG